MVLLPKGPPVLGRMALGPEAGEAIAEELATFLGEKEAREAKEEEVEGEGEEEKGGLRSRKGRRRECVLVVVGTDDEEEVVRIAATVTARLVGRGGVGGVASSVECLMADPSVAWRRSIPIAKGLEVEEPGRQGGAHRVQVVLTNGFLPVKKRRYIE